MTARPRSLSRPSMSRESPRSRRRLGGREGPVRAFGILFSLDTERHANARMRRAGSGVGWEAWVSIDDAYRLDLLRGSFAYDGRLVVGREVGRHERACIHYCVEHSFCLWRLRTEPSLGGR